MIDPNAIYHKLQVAAEEWADLDGKASLLEETKKTIAAQLTLEQIRKGDTAKAAECAALSSFEYGNHVSAMVEARRLANRAKGRLEAARAWFDAVRTVESTKRAEMNIR